MKIFLKKTLSASLICSLVYLPFPNYSYAGKSADAVDAECATDLYNASHGKSTTGDQHMAYCVQADMARRAKNLETTKSVIYFTAGTACTASAVTQALSHKASQAAATAASATIATATTAQVAADAASAAASTASAAAAAAAASAAACGPVVACSAPFAATAAEQYATAVSQAGVAAAQAEAAAKQSTLAAQSLDKAAKLEKMIAKLAKFCLITSTTASASGVATDLIGKKLINDAAERYDQAKDDMNVISTIGGAAMGAGLPILMGGGDISSAATAASTATTQATNAAQQATQVSQAATAASESASALANATTSAGTSVEAAAAASASGAAAAAAAAASAAAAAASAVGVSTKAAADAWAVVNASTKAKGCTLSALSMTLLGAQSADQANNSGKLMDSALASAKSKKGGPDTVTNLNPAQLALQQQTGTTNTSSHGTSNSGSDSTPCADKNGNDYLTCIGTMAPEVAAIMSSDFVNGMNSNLNGKHLGDFVKNYKGNSPSEMASYIAGGLGVSASGVSEVLDKSGKIAKESGFLNSFKPSGFTRVASAPKIGGDDLDFNKMMAGMMGKLDPGAEKKGSQDPAELVFRQMELLPPDKIEANKDISLFARIAYRYRKNANNVEQLNWAREENKGETARAPASAPVPVKK